MSSHDVFCFFYTSLCVLSAWPVNTVRFMQGRRYTVSIPLRPLSTLPLELPSLSTQHVGQAPWVATQPRLTHCVVSMYECARVLRGQRLPEASRLRDSKVPSGHLLCGPLRCVVTRYHR